MLRPPDLRISPIVTFDSSNTNAEARWACSGRSSDRKKICASLELIGKAFLPETKLASLLCGCKRFQADRWTFTWTGYFAGVAEACLIRYQIRHHLAPGETVEPPCGNQGSPDRIGLT